MSNENLEQFKGFTLVWEGLPTDFLPVIQQWASLRQDFIKITTPANPSNLALWVANEHIDWGYYRMTDEFRPFGKLLQQYIESEHTRLKMEESNRKMMQKAQDFRNSQMNNAKYFQADKGKLKEVYPGEMPISEDVSF
jgi:hypothetical protein